VGGVDKGRVVREGINTNIGRREKGSREEGDE